MRRNNMWNRIFHKKELEANLCNLKKYTIWSKRGQEFINAIKVADSLVTLLAIHKDAWRTGFQNESIGPCSYGMFRTEDILTMTPKQVYLGGIWGLNTKSIPFWEDHKNELYGANGFFLNEKRHTYDMVLDQYKTILTSNIEYMNQLGEAELHLYEQAGYKL